LRPDHSLPRLIHMETLSFSVAGMALLGIVLMLWRVIRGMEALVEAPQKPSEGPVTAVLPEYDDTEIRAQLDTFRAALAEGILNVDRNNRRIEAVVRRARKELAESGLEHGGLEAEVGDLQRVDDHGIEDPQVLPMHEALENLSPYDPPSGAPGFTQSELAALRARVRGA